MARSVSWLFMLALIANIVEPKQMEGSKSELSFMLPHLGYAASPVWIELSKQHEEALP